MNTVEIHFFGDGSALIYVNGLCVDSVSDPADLDDAIDAALSEA